MLLNISSHSAVEAVVGLPEFPYSAARKVGENVVVALGLVCGNPSCGARKDE